MRHAVRGLRLAGEERAELLDRAHQRRREDDRRVLVDADLDHRLQVAQLQREGVSHHHVGRASQLAGGERLALGGDDLRALLALGLGLAGHRALHALGQLDVLELDDRDLDAPVLGLHVEDLADVLVDLVGLRQRLVKCVAPDDGAQRRLGDLVDRGVDVLDRHDRADRVVDAEVGHRGDVDADVVACDDPLRLDRHRHDPHRDAVHAVDERDDEDQARAAGFVFDASETELHAPLVLLEDAHAGGEVQHAQGGEPGDHIDGGHVGSLCRSSMASMMRSLCRAAIG